jgi:hypothetical protein
MINQQSTTSVNRVQTIRAMIQPIEDLAAANGVVFDVIVDPGRGPGKSDRFQMSATLAGGQIHSTDPSQEQLSEAYAQYIEQYAERLLTVAKRIRDKFQPVVPA